MQRKFMSRYRSISMLALALFVVLPLAVCAQRLQATTTAPAKLPKLPKPPKAPKTANLIHMKPKQAIESMEQRWRSATLAGDALQMDHLLSDDYVGISWNGQVNTKTSQLNRLKTRTIVLTQLDITGEKVKVNGPVAIVTADVITVGSVDGKDVQGKYRYTRIYQQAQGGEWKITNFEATRIPNPTDRASRGPVPAVAGPPETQPQN